VIAVSAGLDEPMAALRLGGVSVAIGAVPEERNASDEPAAFGMASPGAFRVAIVAAAERVTRLPVAFAPGFHDSR
jgi:hypothetical protein